MTQQARDDKGMSYLSKIRELLVECFNLSELRTLCVDLDVDYENLRGEGKEDKARELVDYFKRRKHLPKLVALCSERRPQVIWPVLPAEVIVAHSVESVKSGLSALVELIQVPDIYVAVERYRDQFQQSYQQITLLQGYKELHDLLHHLKFHCYDPIVIEAERFPGTEITNNLLFEYEMNLAGIIVGLRDVLNTTPLHLGDPAWIDSLERARNELRCAIEQSDLELLKTATRRIWRVLDLHPSRINAHLNVTAQQLLALEMQQSMQRLYSQIASLQPDPVRLREFAAGTAALTELRERLNMLIDDHDVWQSLDRELRQLEAGLKLDTQGLKDDWSELHNRIQQLCAQSAEGWAVALRDCARSLSQVITTDDHRQIKALFRRCCREASNRFFRVDTRLKHLCAQLGEFRDPLTELQKLSL